MEKSKHIIEQSKTGRPVLTSSGRGEYLGYVVENGVTIYRVLVNGKEKKILPSFVSFIPEHKLSTIKTKK